MKSLYDEKDIQLTEEGRKFAKEITDAIKPIFKKYTEKGYSVRQLSHETHTEILFLESFQMLESSIEDRKESKKKGRKKK